MKSLSESYASGQLLRGLCVMVLWLIWGIVMIFAMQELITYIPVYSPNISAYNSEIKTRNQ